MSDVKTDRLAEAATAAAAVTDALARRDRAIVAAADAGASLRDIAAATGIPHMTVKRIIGRRRLSVSSTSLLPAGRADTAAK